ncbi:MAG: hypothetical protein INH37_13710 [Myxococcaceae bacterium]|nr:hypothetical protein [Myxococcaceae bacterium]
MTLGITIRMNGGQNDVTVDGRTFDRSGMTPAERSHLRRLIVEAARKTYPQR